MIEPESFIIAAFLTLFAVVHLTIRCCADAEFAGGRAWWMKAIFKAAQRRAYAEYCKNPVEIARRDSARPTEETGYAPAQ
jgi:hypothetical protein